MKMLLAAGLAALIPLAVLAADGDQSSSRAAPGSQPSSFEALDTNKDGHISMPEASADPKLLESFATADKDGDGYLNATEYASTMKTPPGQN